MEAPVNCSGVLYLAEVSSLVMSLIYSLLRAIPCIQRILELLVDLSWRRITGAVKGQAEKQLILSYLVAEIPVCLCLNLQSVIK